MTEAETGVEVTEVMAMRAKAKEAKAVRAEALRTQVMDAEVKRKYVQNLYSIKNGREKLRKAEARAQATKSKAGAEVNEDVAMSYITTTKKKKKFLEKKESKLDMLSNNNILKVESKKELVESKQLKVLTVMDKEKILLGKKEEII